MGRLARFACFVLSCGVFLAGCIIDPQFEGASVRCTTDDDCAHLQGEFLCDTDARLCVRTSPVNGNGNGGNLCEPECEIGERCVDAECIPDVVEPCPDGCEEGYTCDTEAGACVVDPTSCDPACHPLDECVEESDGFACVPGALEVSIETPEADGWLRDTAALAGTVLSSGEDALSVRCSVAGHQDSVDAVLGEASSAGQEAGVVSTEWACDLDLSQVDEGHLELRVVATEGVREGEAAVGVHRDVTPPQVLGVVALLAHQTDKVYVPQTVVLAVDVIDAMGETAGRVADVRVALQSPEGVVFEGACEALAVASATCEVPVVLAADGEGDFLVEAGAYGVSVEVTDAAGNMKAADYEGLFEVDRMPDVTISLDAPFAVGGDPDGEIPSIAVRRDGRVDIEVVAGRPEQVAGVPRLVLRRGAVQLDECVGPLDLSSRLEQSEDGSWTKSLSAMEPCLDAVNKGYLLAASLRSVWDDPSTNRGPVPCEAPGPGQACADITITRRAWAPLSLCAGRMDCTALTPAVGEDGLIYAAINFTNAQSAQTHAMFVIDPDTAETKTTWSPGADLREHLADGAVVHPTGDEAQAYLLLQEGVLMAVRGSQLAWTWPADPSDVGQKAARGLPALGADGRVYLPVSLEVLSVHEGGVAVLEPERGEPFSGVQTSLLGLDIDKGTGLAVLPGREVEWAALFDPVGQGGRVECHWGTLPFCAARGIMRGATRTGQVVAASAGYCTAFEAGPDDPGVDDDRLEVYRWSRSVSDDAPFWSVGVADVVAGPVAGRLGMVLGTIQGLHIQPNPGALNETAITVALDAPIRGLSLGANGGIYLLYPTGAVEVRSTSGERVLWAYETEEEVFADAAPILASHGEDADGRPVGILYFTSGGLLHALITDDEGPAEGWPNDRGWPSRHGAWVEDGEAVLPVPNPAE
jgi:hypothetical protein